MGSLYGASQVALVVKNSPASAGDLRNSGSIPRSGRSPGGGHGNPLFYSCLENPHGQRSLAGYNPWGRTESDMTEATQQTSLYSGIKMQPPVRWAEKKKHVFMHRNETNFKISCYMVKKKKISA